MSWPDGGTNMTSLEVGPDGLLLIGGGFGQSFSESAIAKLWF